MSTLVIVAGQSNALVFGTKASEIPADLTKPDQHEQIWDWHSQQFETLQPGVNTNAAFPAYAGAFGPEVQFGHDYVQAHPDETVYFVKDKAVQGQTPLALDPNGWDWSPQSRGEQYDKATGQIQAAKAQIPDLTKVVVLWAQGETDTLDPSRDAAYAKNLDDFIAHAKADWGADVVLLSRISSAWGADNGVRSAEDAHGAFSTDLYPLQDDHQHFTGAGAIMLGDDFFAAYDRATSPLPPPPVEPDPIDDLHWLRLSRQHGHDFF